MALATITRATQANEPENAVEAKPSLDAEFSVALVKGTAEESQRAAGDEAKNDLSDVTRLVQPISALE